MCRYTKLEDAMFKLDKAKKTLQTGGWKNA